MALSQIFSPALMLTPEFVIGVAIILAADYYIVICERVQMDRYRRG
jgi:hypothetical protein